MTEATKSLLRRLRQKFFPKPSVFVIHGIFNIEYEHPYDWTVGFCPTYEEALRHVALLEKDLERVRSLLENKYRLYKIIEGKASSLEAYRSSDAVKEELWDLVHAARYAYDEAVDEITPTMVDQSIPYPFSKLFCRKGNSDGPIRYRIKEVIEL